MVGEGPLTVGPPTAAASTGLDLSTLTAGRIVEARVTALAGQMATLASRQGPLEVDLGSAKAAVGDLLRFEVKSIEGGDGQTRLQLELTSSRSEAVSPASAAPSAAEAARQALGGAVAKAVATQSGLSPLYATLAGLASAPSGSVPEPVRALVTQLMNGRLGAEGAPNAANVAAAFRNSGLFLEARGGTATSGVTTGDLKGLLGRLATALETWVGRPAATAGGSSGYAGRGSAPPSSAPPTASPASASGLAVRAAYGGSPRTSGGASLDAAQTGAPARFATAVYGGASASRPATSIPTTTGTGPGPGAGSGPTSGGGAGTVAETGASRPSGLDPSAPPPGGDRAAAPGSAASRSAAQSLPAATGPGDGSGARTPVPPGGAAPAGTSSPEGTSVAAAAGSSGSPPPSSERTDEGASPLAATSRTSPSASPVSTPGAATDGFATVPVSPTGRTSPGVPPGGASSERVGTGRGAPVGTAPSSPQAAALGGVTASPSSVAPAPTAGTAATPVGPVPVGDAAADLATTPGAGSARSGGPPAPPAAADADLSLPVSTAGTGAASSVPGDGAEGRRPSASPGLALPDPEAGDDAASALGATIAGTSRERILRPPPPRRGQMPLAQGASAQESVETAREAESLGRRALARTDGALQRILLEQWAVLDDHGPAAASLAGRDGREWTAELPLATSTGTSIMQMTVERDGGGKGREASGATVGWRVRFALDVEPIGPVHAQIGLSGDHLSVGLWIERPEMAARLAAQVGELTALLADDRVSVEAVHVSSGLPPAQPSEGGGAGHFIDVSL